MKLGYIVYILFIGLFITSCGQPSTVAVIQTNIIVIDTFENGAKKTTLEYQKDDTAYAMRTDYYISGAKYIQGKNFHGLRNGEWSAWTEDGKLLTTGNYLNGIEDGQKIVYYPNGNKRYEGLFSKGNRVELWIFWNEDGTIQKSIDYNLINSKVSNPK
ncbi:MAG: hypothetical protein AUJ98_07555 [Bacteroidetes bacterium CG2_30_33_31]|nr:MAG: hypothetical protein AUJ98_07555 [Bacteroidetes bacterium CG2_30_33_31]